ncbi:MAG: carbohydrate-binding protein, partial [Deltaproteobacteria bacterium]|nr:carbohydrate-binding protein [Deltaproteobacteria bacterium]
DTDTIVRHGDHAVVISYDLPSTLDCNAVYQASVTMQNTGDVTWTRAGGFKLGTKDDEDPFFDKTRVWLSSTDSVPPMGEHTFEMALKAPGLPGDYVTDWQMVHEGVHWFGETASSMVRVSCEKPVDSSTLTRKVMAGYQGWFSAQGDGAGVGWRHWCSGGSPNADNITFDMWPDMREYSTEELFATSFKYRDGSNAGLYSAYTAKTVVRHVKWMKDYGIDGVFVQRFLVSIKDLRFLQIRDKVLNSIRHGAEQYGRVFANMYDISGANEKTLVQDLENDWKHLVDDEKITGSSRYLWHKGKPVLAIWGLGFKNHPGTPAQAAELISWFERDAPQKYRVTLMGGLPTHWRTLTGDSKEDTAWSDVYRSFDIISPWAVGRYGTPALADDYRQKNIEPDLKECRRLGIDYMPVIFPGFSWFNLHGGDLNQISRQGGRFFWRQAYNAVDSGNDMIYVAMFDEVDEGTAIYKIAENSSQVPTTGSFVTLDADGENLPSDWYLRLTGEASKMLRGEIGLTSTIPIEP